MFVPTDSNNEWATESSSNQHVWDVPEHDRQTVGPFHAFDCGFDRPQAGLRVGRVAAELNLFTEVMSHKVRGNFGIGSGSKYVTDFL